jgi:replication fork protection complex subunit Tof1/Swi1
MGMMELEFKKNKGLSWSQQMGVVVGVLVQAGHQVWITWIIEVCFSFGFSPLELTIVQVLEVALAARQEVVLAIDGSAESRGLGEDEDEEGDERARDFSGPSRDAIERFQRVGE